MPKPSLEEAPRWTFTRSYRQGASNPSQTPGPGAYSVLNSTLQTVGPSFRPRLTPSTVMESPGPGAYDLSHTFTEVMPAYSLGKSPRETISPERRNPSPVHYSPKSIQKSLPAYTISQEKRSFDSKKADLTPGPGQYSPKFPDSKATVSLSSRHKDTSATLKASIPV